MKLNKFFKIFCLLSVQAFLLLLVSCDGEKKQEHVSINYADVKGPNSYPAEWAWVKRTFPEYKMNLDAVRESIEQGKTQRKQLRKSASVEWQFAGPENVGGRVVDIEFDPKQPNIVYAASATGGVFKSTDTGINWQPIFDQTGVLTIGDIGIDPVNTNNIYVGTGEANGGHNNFPGLGVFKSTDGGDSWSYSGLGNTASIGRVVVDPENPQRIWVAAVGSYFASNSERGVYLSEDGGQTWQQSLFISDSSGAIDILINPEDPQILYAAMWERIRPPVEQSKAHLWGRSSGIWRTMDGGKNWQRLGPGQGLPDPAEVEIGRIGLSGFQQAGDIVCALFTHYSQADGYTIHSLYRTMDGGDSWTELSEGSNFSEATGGFSWYFGQVRIHPTDPDRIFVLDVGLTRTTDGGENWPYLNRGSGSLHVDHHAMAFHPSDPDYVISGNDGGINISLNGGDTWSKVAKLPVTQFYEIGLDEQNPSALFGGTQDNGTQRTLTGGFFDWELIFGGDGFYVIVDPANPQTVFAESQFGNLYRIEGHDYTSITTPAMMSQPRNWSTPVVMDPNDSQVLYYGTDRIWRSGDQGNLWLEISPDLSRQLADSRVGTVTTIAVAPTNSQVIYAGTDDGMIWNTTDGGENWIFRSDNLPFRWVTRVVVDPQNPAIAYATYSGLRWRDPLPYVFRTENYGQTWQDITANLPQAPINAFAVDNHDSDILYLGSDIGAFVSFDAGQSWEVLGNGLPVVVVNDMKIHPTSNELVVGTHGRSMYKLDLDQLTGINSYAYSKNLPSRFKLGQNYPNPFNSTTAIEYFIHSEAHVSITLHSIDGRQVSVLVDDLKTAGRHHLFYDAQNLSSGIYVYRMQVDGHSISRRMIYLK